jgi:hypothetical protein
MYISTQEDDQKVLIYVRNIGFPEVRRISSFLGGIVPPSGFPGASRIALGRIQHQVSGKRSQHGWKFV